MKTFYVEVDTNDGDYVGNIVEIEDEIAKKFEPLIKKIAQFTPYNVNNWTHDSNFPVGDCLRTDLGEKDPCELYNIDENTYEEFVDAFELHGSEWGFHTITKIQEITLGKVWLG